MQSIKEESGFNNLLTLPVFRYLHIKSDSQLTLNVERKITAVVTRGAESLALGVEELYPHHLLVGNTLLVKVLNL